MARVVTTCLRVPEWVGDEDVERIVREIEERLENSVPVAALRKVLGIRGEEELLDRLEPVDWREFEEKEKERLRRFYRP